MPGSENKNRHGSRSRRAPHRKAREAIGDAALFIGANGAFSARGANNFAGSAAGAKISWFEEPVPSDDLPGLGAVHAALPAIDVAAGEYYFAADDVRLMLEAKAVDMLQCKAKDAAAYAV